MLDSNSEHIVNYISGQSTVLINQKANSTLQVCRLPANVIAHLELEFVFFLGCWPYCQATVVSPSAESFLD